MNDTVTRLARRGLFGRSAGFATIAALSVTPAAAVAEADPKPMEKIMTPDVTHALPVSHHTAELNGIRVHYVTAGTGEPVVLVHGFPQTWYAWRKITPALAARYTVIAPDLRGCGDTDRPDVTFDKRTAAEDIHQLVQHLGVGPVNLVGHDVGTMVSYAYAATYRNEVRRLALMESALPGFGLEDLYDADAYPRMYHLGLSEAPNGLAEALINGRELMFVSHFMRQQTYDPTGPDEDALAEYALRLGAPGALRCGLGYFRSHKIDAEHNRQSARTKLAMPVLTVGASLSFKDILAERTPELAEHVRSVVIPECGHYLAEEQPDRLAAVLLSFLGAPA
jgi:pimeloyl-ACP methyl ester carboxylesterase